MSQSDAGNYFQDSQKNEKYGTPPEIVTRKDGSQSIILRGLKDSQAVNRYFRLMGALSKADQNGDVDDIIRIVRTEIDEESFIMTGERPKRAPAKNLNLDAKRARKE